MLEGFALSATKHERAQRICLGLIKRLFKIQVELHTRHFQDVRKKELHLKTRRFHPFFLQKLGAALERFQNCHSGSVTDAQKRQKGKYIAPGRGIR